MAACWGVFVSGVAQLALLMAEARRRGVLERLAVPRFDPDVKQFFAALGPAVIGSAGQQIAILADTILASLLPNNANSSMYYAERLYQLPLGVIGVAAGTVLLPEMSRRLAAGDARGAAAAQNRSIALTFALAAPFFVAFLVLPEETMRGAFLRGAFTAQAARGSAAVLAAYGLGLAPMVLIRSAVASFQSRGDTTTPMLCFFAGLAVNLALKYALYQPMGPAGLALATATGAWINFALLIALGMRRHWFAPDKRLIENVAIAAFAAGAAAFAAPFCFHGRRPLSRPPAAVAQRTRHRRRRAAGVRRLCDRLRAWARSPSAARRESSCCNEKLGLPDGPICARRSACFPSPSQGNSCRAARSSSSAPVTPASRPRPVCARKARTIRSSCSRASPTCPTSARRCRRRSSRARWTSPACRCAPSSSIARSRSTSGSAFRRRASTSPARRVELGAGGAEPFDHLILATGARPRPFAIPGAELDGVLTLRNIADAAAIRERLGPGRRVVVIGAGFIGLEIAATALAVGGEVTVVEIARPLGRAVSPPTSDFFLDAHQAFGARFRLGVGVNAIEGAKGAAAAVVLADGERVPADLVIVGVGVLAEDALARAAGLACDNGDRRRRAARRLRPGRCRRSAIARSSRSIRSARCCASNRCRTRPTRRAPSRGG